MGDTLGKGSHGKVLQSPQVSTGEQVAVKIMNKKLPLGIVDALYERRLQ